MSTKNPQQSADRQPVNNLDSAKPVNPSGDLTDTQIIPPSVVATVRQVELPAKFILATLEAKEGGIVVDVNTNQGEVLARSLAANAQKRNVPKVTGTIDTLQELRYSIGTSVINTQVKAISVKFESGNDDDPVKLVILSAKLLDGSVVNFAELCRESMRNSASTNETLVGSQTETQVDNPSKIKKSPSETADERIADQQAAVLHRLHKKTFDEIEKLAKAHHLDLVKIEAAFTRIMSRPRDFTDKADFKNKLEALAKILLAESGKLKDEFQNLPTLTAVIHESVRFPPIRLRHQLAAPTAYLAQQLVEKSAGRAFGLMGGDADAKIVAPFLRHLEYASLLAKKH